MRPGSGPAEAAYRASLFVLPVALAFLYVVALLPVLSAKAWPIVFGGMVTYLLAPVGVEIVIPAVIIALQSFDAAPHELVLGVTSVVLVDVFMALFVAWNWDLVERIPVLGGAVRRVEDKCRQVIVRRRWGERATLTALAAYVAFPVQMTGGLFGSLLGRVMGLGKVRVFLAVTAGSVVGAIPMGILAWLVGPPVLEFLASSTVAGIAAAAGILITVAFVAAIAYLYLRGRRHANRG